MDNGILNLTELGQPLFKKLFPVSEEQKLIREKLDASIYPEKYKNIYELGAAAARPRAAAASSSKKAPPITNRGVSRDDLTSDTEFVWAKAFDALETKEIKAIGKGNSIFITVPKRDQAVNFEFSFIDYINFTFKVSDFHYEGVSNDDFMISFSPVLQNIFGFGITGKRENGLNFYKQSYDLGMNGWGTACIGGQRDTVLITLKGQGLQAARTTWPKLLYGFLESIPSASITRVDLAHDAFSSTKSVDDYLNMYKADMFTNRGQRPNVSQAGNWIEPDGKGRTLYIGSRSSGKLLRIYEKGLQLGRGYAEIYPEWVRTELELRNDGRVIPLDVLKYPNQYLAGAYPALKLFAVVQKVAESKKKSAQSTVAAAIEITKTQFGKYLWTFKELYGVEKAFELLTAGKEEPPKRLDFSNFLDFDPLLNLSPKRTITLEEIII